MKNFKALAIAAITAAATFAGPAAQARGTYAEHTQLGNAVRATGITLKFNPAECRTKNAMGWYWAAKREMVICQENHKGYVGFGQEVRWTEEDLDTLRHEAQHLIQDCMNGSLDGSLGAVYQDPIRLAKETLSQRHIQHIINVYAEGGASEHIVVMELEAFSVAALNDPAEQTRDIQKFCF